jgi:hypothetical protein
LRRHLNAECSRALMTDIYESFKSVYFPTNAIETESKSRSWLHQKSHEFQQAPVRHTYSVVIVFHRRSSKVPCSSIFEERPRLGRLSRRSRNETIPWDWSNKGTWYTDVTSCTPTTCSDATWQNMDIFSFVAFAKG